MKVLTNIQSIQIGGIAKSMLSFLNFLKINNHDHISLIGVDIDRTYDPTTPLSQSRSVKDHMTIIKKGVYCQHINKALQTMSNLDQLEQEYQDVVEFFDKIIHSEKPDLIVLNGTYVIPWCLYLAAKKSNIPILLHYHGMISKETATWDAHSRSLMEQMEKTFDNDRLQYIFPSHLARKTVEDEIFEHKIASCAILASPIPEHFFQHSNSQEYNSQSRYLGVVGRWTQVKNPQFVIDLAKYNRRYEKYFDINLVTNTQDISANDRFNLGKINILDSMSSQDLGGFYSQMGAILCPSIFETYGNVPQEAVASGTPALVSEGMGVAEVFREYGLEEYIVSFASVANVYEKTKAISTRRVSKAIRKNMQQGLSSHKINSDLLHLYKQTSN